MTRMQAKSRIHFILLLLPHLFLLLHEGTFLIEQKDFIIQKENDMLAASSTAIVLTENKIAFYVHHIREDDR